MRCVIRAWSTASAASAFFVGAALLLTPTVSGAAPPQQQGSTQQEAAAAAPAALARVAGFSASVEMVRVPVVVVDKDGSFIRGLKSESFEIRDGGTNHPVAHFVADSEPVTVGILVDASSAMSAYEADVRLAIVLAANNLRPDDELFLIGYGAKAIMLSPPSVDRLQLTSAVDGYFAGGPDRALYDAIALGLATLDTATYDKRSLVLIGSGSDTSSSVAEISVQQEIHRTGVTIHAVSLSPRSNRVRASPARVNRTQTLAEIVRFSGGLLAKRPQTFGRFGGPGGWLQAAGNDITTYVKHQYLLHYSPLNPPRPGTWRAISLRLDVDFEKVRARSGYIR